MKLVFQTQPGAGCAAAPLDSPPDEAFWEKGPPGTDWYSTKWCAPREREGERGGERERERERKRDTESERERERGREKERKREGESEEKKQ